MPPQIVQRLRAACAHLPEAYEEHPFAGVRWRIRGSTLAHLVTRQYPHGPVTYVTFHAAGEELEALSAMGDPFYPGWGDIFADTTIAAAMLDRLLHRSVVVNISGDSYRMRAHRARARKLTSKGGPA